MTYPVAQPNTPPRVLRDVAEGPHAEKLSIAAWTEPPGWAAFTFGLEQTSTPLFLLDAAGLVRFANFGARESLRGSTVLRLINGRLQTRRREERRMLAEAVENASTSNEAVTATLRDRAGRVVLAMLMQMTTPAGLPPVLLVRVADLLAVPPSDPAWISRIFGLTRSEARVTGGLLDGLDIERIAERDGTAIETVRGHVKRAMGKVGVRSQAQLVRVLAHGHGALVVPSD